MKWIEVIHLRTTEDNVKKLFNEISGLVAATSGNTETGEIRLYRHCRLDTDMSIHIHWENKGPAGTESRIGLRLADLLKEHGLVHYSVWVENELN